MCNMLVGSRFAEKANLHLSFVRVLMKRLARRIVSKHEDKVKIYAQNWTNPLKMC